MDALQIIFIAVLVFAGIGLFHILLAKPTTGNAMIAAVLCAVFSVYTAIQITSEGVMMFFTNHTGNLTGIQVWWDLVMCVIIALFFIAPRARTVGMNVPLWALFVGSTASIGLLAMVARMFWLEQQAVSSSQSAASA